jgi:hypothetical protein
MISPILASELAFTSTLSMVASALICRRLNVWMACMSASMFVPIRAAKRQGDSNERREVRGKWTSSSSSRLTGTMKRPRAQAEGPVEY